MSTQASDALRFLVAALETHLESAATRRGPIDAAVDDAYDAVAEAFEAYEEALDVEYGEALPIVLEEDDLYEDESEAGEPEDSSPPVDDLDDDEELDPHAEEDEDDMDDDLVEFDLR